MHFQLGWLGGGSGLRWRGQRVSKSVAMMQRIAEVGTRAAVSATQPYTQTLFSAVSCLIQQKAIRMVGRLRMNRHRHDATLQNHLPDYVDTN